MTISFFDRDFSRFGSARHKRSPSTKISKQLSYPQSLPTMKLNMKPHTMSIKPSKFILLWLAINSLVAIPLQAELFSLSASGTIAKNNSADTTLPVGTPWTFEITYDTAAPDLDF